jgi:hypothetical protein
MLIELENNMDISWGTRVQKEILYEPIGMLFDTFYLITPA